MKKIYQFKMFLKSYSRCPKCGHVIRHPGDIHICS